MPGTSPAAGAAFSFTQPGTFVGLLLSLVVQLVTDATVANRTVRLEFDDGNGLIFARSAASPVQTATQTGRYAFTADRTANDSDTNLFFQAPAPQLYVLGGQKVQVNVTNIGAADQLSGIVMLWERFRTGDDSD